LSAPNGKIVLSLKMKGSLKMTYTITLETFNGSTKKINLSSKGQVAQFISTYPTQLPVGVSVKVACDTLGISGTLRGTSTLTNSN
jgi:hypothetical protein